MLHDVAYSLFYRAPSATQPFPVREARHDYRPSPWTGLAAALERRWLGLYGSDRSVFPLTVSHFRVGRFFSPEEEGARSGARARR